MLKYSYEEKLKAVLRVIDDGMSIEASARIIGVNKKQLRLWIGHYNVLGKEGLSIKNRTYTGEYKIYVIEYMHNNNMSLFETAIKFSIPGDSLVAKWEQLYKEEGPQALFRDNRGRKPKMSSDKQPKNVLNKQTEKDLIAEVERLRMENAYLKKLQALVQKRIDRESGKKQPPSTN